jgi:integrase
MSAPGRISVRVVWGTASRPGTRPKRVSLTELRQVERSTKKVDTVLLAFSAWMADRRPRPLRPASRTQYVRWVRRAMRIAQAGGYSLMAADVRTVRYICGKVPVDPSSQNGVLNAMSAFFEFLKSQGVRKDNPVAEIGRPPQYRGKPRPLALEDCLKYLEAGWELGPVHWAIATLGIYEGFRHGEMRTRRWVDFFEADGRTWCDVEGKGGRKRRMPLHSEAARAVVWLRQHHRHPTWLFPSPFRARWNEPVSEATMRQRHLEIVDSAGLMPEEGSERKPPTLHMLRHSFATLLRRGGGDLAVVQKGLGHASPNTSMIYMEVLDSELADAIDRIDIRRMVNEMKEERRGRHSDQGTAG